VRKALIGLVLAVAGCASTGVGGEAFAPNRLAGEPGWTGTPGVPVLRQTRELDCGPVAAAMLLGFYGRPVAPDALRAEAKIQPQHGLPAGQLRDLLRARGLAAFLVEGGIDDLEKELAAGRPVLVGLAKPFNDKQALGHYEIVAGLNRKAEKVATVDPGGGWREYPMKVFMAEWEPTKHLTIIAGPTGAQSPQSDGQ
jgi:ABC-type bacteriocin/lantibiotic exporter with double-glycine peptidase domain